MLHDFQEIDNMNFLKLNELNNSTILITGATGLIGYHITSYLIHRNIVHKSNIKILLLVRNMDKARRLFSPIISEEDNSSITYIVGDIKAIPHIENKIDYIIHGASPTASKFFVDKPVETIKTAVIGTINILELAVSHHVKSCVYLSSMEIYGSPHTEKKLSEKVGTTIDTMQVRSSYPEAKRLCETLCKSYESEYGANIRVVRLAQTFGPVFDLSDQRVFMLIANSIINNNNIIFNTDGLSKRPYLYLSDAVSAILTILLLGKDGEAYNVGNKDTYCSIKKMAEIAVNSQKSNIEIITKKEILSKYPSRHNLNLAMDKIESLGWKPTKNLPEMYAILIKSIYNLKKNGVIE